MDAHVEDFLTGLLDGCSVLSERWQRRELTGADWALARLSCWGGLAHTLPADLTGPNGPRLELDTVQHRLMWSESRALKLLAGSGQARPEEMPDLVDRLYAVTASRFDPPAAFTDAASRQAVVEWAARHANPPSLPQSAMALVDFIQMAPLVARNAQIAALLASVLPCWAGAPMVHVLPPEGRTEEGFIHALAAACDGEDGAWIAYYLGKARGVLKRMPALYDGTRLIHARYVDLFRRALEPDIAEHVASELVALPVITPSFVADTGIKIEHLRDAMVLLFAADEAVEVDVPGEAFTILPAPLRLLNN
ncbi:MAG: hypothetical protein H7Y60_08125 [Rhodospirillaceae bacterium]|nr:hypothetical protein [Rhodospirillales bacterium]